MKSSAKISLPSFMQIHLYCNVSYKAILFRTCSVSGYH